MTLLASPALSEAMDERVHQFLALCLHAVACNIKLEASEQGLGSPLHAQLLHINECTAREETR